MKESVENTAIEQNEEKDQSRFFVRLIDKNGQSSVTEFSDDSKAIKFAEENDNPKEGVYPHAYDRKQTDEKGNYKKIYPIAQSRLQ